MTLSSPLTRRRLAACLAGLAAVPVLAACSGGDTTAAPDPSQAVRTALPGLSTPSGDPTPEALRTARPAAGTVVQVKGPFDDRFTLTGLRLADGTVRAHLAVTSDVSTLIELQVVAGFYDASGAFLGTGTYTLHVDEEHEGTSTPHAHETPAAEVVIAAPASMRGRVASAAVSVPVLVNE